MLKVVSSTEDRDLGREAILKALNDADGAHADIGIFDQGDAVGGKRPDGEITNAQIGAVHEFGVSIRHGRSGGETIVIPERSWLRSNHDKNVSTYNARLDKQYGKILQGTARVIPSLLAFAERVASDVRRNITALREPELAESTKRRKGSSNPLIDTGTMRNSVQGRVIVHGIEV